jgi:hypothetical protein
MPVDGDVTRAAVLGGADAHAVDAGFIAQDLVDAMVPDQTHLAGARTLQQAILQDFFGAQLVAPVHQRHVFGEVRQIQGLLHRGIAAADTATRWPRKKKPSQVAQADTPGREISPPKAGPGSAPRHRWR